MTNQDWLLEVGDAVGPITRHQLLSAGCLGPVHVVWAGGRKLVAKIDESAIGGLEVEAEMLRYLGSHSNMNVPQVLHVSPRVLVMTHIEGQTGCSGAAEPGAAVELARLHAIKNPRFGFDFDTRIGGLVQPNAWSDSWLEFFAEHRLVHMAKLALDTGRIRRRQVLAVERIARSLRQWIAEPKEASLLHGDLWSGNILSSGGQVVGFLDPAVYFGHPEAEIAFVTLFSTFDDAFFRTYEAMTVRKLDHGFWNERRNIYNVYPLLVHVCLVGGSYVADLNEMLDRYA
ncbi:MAG: fructosamine kinase family protein [Planctomycetes bacterium]|nr:fructosamine kinase family protein [Planctomycetota bacterium]